MIMKLKRMYLRLLLNDVDYAYVEPQFICSWCLRHQRPMHTCPCLPIDWQTHPENYPTIQVID